MWPRDSPRCGPGTPRAGLAPAILSAEPANALSFLPLVLGLPSLAFWLGICLNPVKMGQRFLKSCFTFYSAIVGEGPSNDRTYSFPSTYHAPASVVSLKPSESPLRRVLQTRERRHGEDRRPV